MNHRAQELFDFIVQHPGLTERQIADGVGLKKTPYTRQILLSLIAEGSVVRTPDPNSDRLTYVYHLQQTEQLL